MVCQNQKFSGGSHSNSSGRSSSSLSSLGIQILDITASIAWSIDICASDGSFAGCLNVDCCCCCSALSEGISRIFGSLALGACTSSDETAFEVAKSFFWYRSDKWTLALSTTNIVIAMNIQHAMATPVFLSNKTKWVHSAPNKNHHCLIMNWAGNHQTNCYLHILAA